MSGIFRGVLLAALYCALASLALGQSVTLTNDSNSRDYPSDPFIVGDPFTLTVTGQPNKAVTMEATHNGGSPPYNWSLGTTNSNGVLVVQDVMGAWAVGHWTEIVYVDGHEAYPELEFEIEYPEPCHFSPTGQEDLPSMLTKDAWYSQGQNSPVTFKQWQPQVTYHSVVSGPCHASGALSWTGIVEAEYEYEDFETEGYKKVRWMLEDDGEESSQRCNILNNPCYPSFHGYTFYENGFVMSYFRHADTLEEYQIVSHYWLHVEGCVSGPYYCLP